MLVQSKPRWNNGKAFDHFSLSFGDFEVSKCMSVRNLSSKMAFHSCKFIFSLANALKFQVNCSRLAPLVLGPSLTRLIFNSMSDFKLKIDIKIRISSKSFANCLSCEFIGRIQIQTELKLIWIFDVVTVSMCFQLPEMPAVHCRENLSTICLIFHIEINCCSRISFERWSQTNDYSHLKLN